MEYASIKEKELKFTNEDLKCAEYRGKIIHCMTNIEYLTEQIIVRYFFHKSPKSGLEFMYAILSKENFSLSAKFKAFKFIMDIFPDYMNKHKYIKPLYEELIELRNIYAHRRHFNGTMTLLHNTTENNKMVIKQTEMNQSELELFYGKYNLLKNDLNNILKLIEKEVK